MYSSWVIIEMAPSDSTLSVLGSSDKLEEALIPTGGPGQEEHGLSYDREVR